MIKKLIDKLFYKKYEITIWQRGYMSNYYKAYKFKLDFPFYKKINDKTIKIATNKIIKERPKGVRFEYHHDGSYSAKYFIQYEQLK